MSLLAADTGRRARPGRRGRDRDRALRAVDPKLAGGSCRRSPAWAGWRRRATGPCWTSGRPARSRPPFIAEAAGRGLRYVALPVNLETLDPTGWRGSSSSSAAPEARPLFFFDADGSRAGALWYIRRVTVDRVDAQIARREAEEIGLKDQAPGGWRPLMWIASRPPGPTPRRLAPAPPILATPSGTLASSTSPRASRTKAAGDRDRRQQGPAIITDAPGDRPDAGHPPLFEMPKPTTTTAPADASRRLVPAPGRRDLAAVRGDAAHGSEPAAGLLDAHRDPGRDRRGLGPVCRHRRHDLDRFPTSRVIESSAIGRAARSGRRRPIASIRLFAPYFASPMIGSPRLASCTLS